MKDDERLQGVCFIRAWQAACRYVDATIRFNTAQQANAPHLRLTDLSVDCNAAEAELIKAVMAGRKAGISG